MCHHRQLVGRGHNPFHAPKIRDHAANHNEGEELQRSYIQHLRKSRYAITKAKLSRANPPKKREIPHSPDSVRNDEMRAFSQPVKLCPLSLGLFWWRGL